MLPHLINTVAVLPFLVFNIISPLPAKTVTSGVHEAPAIILTEEPTISPISPIPDNTSYVESTPEIVSTPSTDVQSIAQQTLAEMGLSDQWDNVNYIFSHESGWNPSAVNHIGCIGLGQSCPGGSGLLNDCPDWQTDVACQTRHFTKYASRYGGWTGAYQFWINNKWW